MMTTTSLLRGVPFVLSAWAAMTGAALAAKGGSDMTVYVGTYTQGESKGIYRLHFNAKTGALGDLSLVAETPNPSWLVLHPNGQYLYAANENGDAAKDAVSAFAIDADGGLKLLNAKPSRGAAPCHLAMDAAGRHVLVANYLAGNVAAYAVGDDGTLGESTAIVQHEGHGPLPNQEAPHAHAITFAPGQRLLFVSDLGIDKLVAYRYDAATGALTTHAEGTATILAGSGPRHFTFDRQGRHAYSVNEMALTVTAFDYDAEPGRLRTTQVLSMLGSDTPPEHSSAAEIALRPDGRFLYASSRGPDEISVFSVGKSDGKLALVERQKTRGKTPRHFTIDATGRYLLAANQNSDDISVFRIDRATGKLTAVGEPVHVPRPVCILMRPSR